jgi:hypothetical protein
MDPWEIEGRLDVSQTIGEYSHLVDRAQAQQVSALFAYNGVIENGAGKRAEGRAEIVEFLLSFASDGATNGLTFLRHHVTNIIFTALSPERIEASSYFFAVSDAGLYQSGRYRDVFVPLEHRWLFAHRFVRLDATPRWGV